MLVTDFTRSNAIRNRFYEAIRGGARTYKRGDDQFPGGMSPSFVVSYSHRSADIYETIEAAGDLLRICARAMASGRDKFLHGRSVKPVCRRRYQQRLSSQC